ncbi:hypothetical protein ASZ90_002780 [hydrocarbon metagenome]|uniref:Uncharacterized protein n=1 Tax=hydrocarbon metagenome TaxID=938273 RepID=A0A0W8G2H7_9ZZZZ
MGCVAHRRGATPAFRPPGRADPGPAGQRGRPGHGLRAQHRRGGRRLVLRRPDSGAGRTGRCGTQHVAAGIPWPGRHGRGPTLGERRPGPARSAIRRTRGRSGQQRPLRDPHRLCARPGFGSGGPEKTPGGLSRLKSWPSLSQPDHGGHQGPAPVTSLRDAAGNRGRSVFFHSPWPRLAGRNPGRGLLVGQPAQAGTVSRRRPGGPGRRSPPFHRNRPRRPASAVSQKLLPGTFRHHRLPALHQARHP